MNDFVELLKLAEKREYEDKTFPERSHRTIKGTTAGNFNMSIQASYYHYCTPRETVPLDEYSEFEIALFDDKRNWLTPYQEQFKDFPRVEELKEHWDGEEGIAVGGYVPKDLIQELYEYLCKVSESNER